MQALGSRPTKLARHSDHCPKIPRMGDRRFDDAWQEQVVLKDGTSIVMRLLRPGDRQLLARGFERLSHESRVRRFLMDKDHLTEAELDYLTETDGDHHLAIAAALAEDETQGLGVARFVRLEKDPEVAEPAVAVVDDFQGRGLGRLLLHRLEAAAWERGVRRFRALVQASNAPMLSLLSETPPVRISTLGDGSLEVEIELHPFAAEDDERTRGPLYRLLTLAARGVVRMLRPPPAEGTRGEGEPSP